MEVKRCTHCNTVFKPEGTGRRSILCWDCSLDCEESFNKIRKWMRQTSTRSSDVESVSTATGVPKVFLEVLQREGRLEDLFPPQKKEDRHCKQCHIVLSIEKGDYCTPCQQSLVGDIKEIITLSAEAQKQQQQHAQDAARTQSRSVRERQERYGLKRNF